MPPTFTEPEKYFLLIDSKIFGCFEKLWVWIVHFWYQSVPQVCLCPLARPDSIITIFYKNFTRIYKNLQEILKSSCNLF
jgi:hypothetical protein